MRRLSIMAVAIVSLFCFGCDKNSDPGDDREARATEPQVMDEDDEQPVVAEETDGEPSESKPAGDVEKGDSEEAEPDSERDRIVEQPRMEAFAESATAGDHEPGSTDFQPGDRQLPDSLVGSESTDEHLYAVAAELRLTDGLGTEFEELSYRLVETGPDEALGVIAIWGLRDDATVGRDLLVHLERDDGLWFVDELEERYHCRRGVDGQYCL